MTWLQDFVQDYLNFTGKCFHHCNKPTTMRIMNQASNRIIGAYVCPDAFVSQVVYFTDAKPDLEWFQRLISNQVGRRYGRKRDIRAASRHGWELGGSAREAIKQHHGSDGRVTEVYWTRYPTTPEQKQHAVSLCIGKTGKPGCLRLFVHSRRSEPVLCPKCKSKREA